MQCTRSRSADDLSQGSTESSDSYAALTSPSSDYSDCEFCEERKRKYNSLRSPQCKTSYLNPVSCITRYYNTMDRRETEPLVTSPSAVPVYMSVTSESDSLGPGEFSSSEILATHKRIENQRKPDRRKQSSLVTIFSVWNTIMGSSLLTMAWGVERAGLPVALVLVAIMSALCLYTAYVLLRVHKRHGTGSATCEVPALCRILLGQTAEGIAHVFSLIVLFGANIVYWILITNFLYFTVNYFVDLTSNTTDYNTTLLCPKHDGVNGSLIIPVPNYDTPYWGLHSTVPVYVAVIVFPLLNFKNVSFFTKFNSLGTLSVAYLLIFVLVKSIAWGVNIETQPTDAHPGQDAAVLSGMLALSFYIHNIIITIMSNNDRQENNGRDLTIAFILVTLTYILVGGVFYICFPLAKSCIEDNILNNFEMHDIMTAVARILLLFQVVTVYPLVAYMLRCEAILLLPFQDNRCLTISINTGIVAVCIVAACFCPNIGTIIRYTGAVSGLVHIFALPSLLQVRSLQLRGELSLTKAILYCSIVLCGAINLVMQFFIKE
ncbi:sodium-coupled neutral amino acid transporter 9 homolog [Hyposmocoma kahamanoa]|uniref:sodium-coupled neutral amino acid transporter 9 homolog n=1 Tax=Hyposmocoma kahamanoa TaxID=1477025 RepID=UPI000E6D6D32|nr:sodium-coupled neutral amino acid transporter 9 homolog [Hyposmocoma kahamanoa]